VKELKTTSLRLLPLWKNAFNIRYS